MFSQNRITWLLLPSSLGLCIRALIHSIRLHCTEKW